ncbi:hypothetical protein [Leclercia adecarboxylata]|uniref:hypothetical protein n=1 Tax=Leclercia adecarboxylata TaxID=83655 RepID=UPI0022E8D040|nr:hypothetical protein [Leclercia adecarboxylata]
MTKFTNKQLTDQAREEVDFWRERDELIPSQQTAIRLRLAEIAMAALMTPEPEPVADVVAWSSPSEERTCDIRWRRHDVKPGPLYTAPPALVVPEEATPGSIEILASIRPPHGVAYQWDEEQRHAAADAWNACRGAMMQDAEPSQNDELPEWLQQAHKLAELHGCSFVVFRHGEEAQCADPTKVIISFTDEGLGHHLAASQQEDPQIKK